MRRVCNGGQDDPVDPRASNNNRQHATQKQLLGFSGVIAPKLNRST